MAVTPTQYGLFLESLYEGRIDIRNDPLMFMICTASYTPSQNAHKFRSVVTNEIIGSGYSAGGKQIMGAAIAYTGSNKTLTLTGSPLAWPLVTWSNARYGVIYVARDGIPITSQPLVAWVDFGANVSKSDEPFYVTWPATGIMKSALP